MVLLCCLYFFYGAVPNLVREGPARKRQVTATMWFFWAFNVFYEVLYFFEAVPDLVFYGYAVFTVCEVIVALHSPLIIINTEPLFL